MITPDGFFGWQKDCSSSMVNFSGLTLSRLAQSAREAAAQASDLVTGHRAGRRNYGKERKG